MVFVYYSIRQTIEPLCAIKSVYTYLGYRLRNSESIQICAEIEGMFSYLVTEFGITIDSSFLQL